MLIVQLDLPIYYKITIMEILSSVNIEHFPYITSYYSITGTLSEFFISLFLCLKWHDQYFSNNYSNYFSPYHNITGVIISVIFSVILVIGKVLKVEQERCVLLGNEAIPNNSCAT